MLHATSEEFRSGPVGAKQRQRTMVRQPDNFLTVPQMRRRDSTPRHRIDESERGYALGVRAWLAAHDNGGGIIELSGAQAAKNKRVL